ncbi:uncharacterized protein LOC113505644 isoform X2 [Trichoplusia ni]|uniref:Uncharacterized protein LOC113505644 isoform X2 n=1 Tax=Trichoplusia ni TaxID=7111 RepID=A0A7E5WUN2_TRINI|nr:uncharacterized protein LOC113505644 isoform X2 [Trichoplusia ni]
MVLDVLRIIFNKFWKVLVCSKRLYGTQRLAFGLLVGFSMCATTILFLFNQDRPRPIGLNDTKVLVQSRLKEIILLEKGTGCEMPELDPFSAEAMRFIVDLPKIKCEGFDWVKCVKSQCFVVTEILETMKDISCTYREIIYVNDKLYLIDNPVKVRGGNAYNLNRSDHVKVSCSGMDKTRPSIVSTRWYGYKAGFRPVAVRKKRPMGLDNYNVLVLGFDSASHNGFMRKMPNSFKYLSEKAVILNRYNIVGDGTPAALYPILTGRAEEEHPDARKKATEQRYVEDRLFIFHQLKGYGYRTAFFEDMPWIGTFQYRFNGFRKQPADHYLRAFFLEEKKYWMDGLNKQNQHCVGAIPQYKFMLDLTDQFLQLDGKKFCFTFIVDVGHDNFNLISNADEDLVAFLETLDQRKAFEDTLVIIMGDHGSRFEGIRETYQGKLEERLPLMAIMLPDRLKALRPGVEEALARNRDVLTTPFDIHTTLLDVLGLKKRSSKHKIPGSDLRRALSLLEPIPESRSCAEAGIMPHWCACTKWFNVSISDPMYNHIATLLAEFIDGISKEQRAKCVTRQLVQVDWVLHRSVNSQLLKYGYKNEMDTFLGNPRKVAPRPEKEYYQAKIVLSPGRGVFEGTVTYYPQADSILISEKDISRVNAYGDESSCVTETHPHLNKYCYCSEIFVTRSPNPPMFISDAR